jgi:hypothetical protein
VPIEIKELVIRTQVGHGSGVTTADNGGGVKKGGSETASTEEIVQECVRQVLRVLKKERER